MSPAQITPSDAQAYLQAYGYIPKPQAGTSQAPWGMSDLAGAFGRLAQIYRWAFGEQPPGQGGIARLVTQARCSVSDPFNPMTGLIQPAIASASSCKWPHKTIRFAQEPSIAGLAPSTVFRLWRAAIQSWADVCGITPIVGDPSPNVWATGQPIDGPGRVLAWSMLPCGMLASDSCEQRYDSREPWDQYGEAYLQEVFAHEIGHALGLDHDQAGTLMAPYATGKVVVPQERDKAQVRARYGPPVTVPVDPPIGELSIEVIIDGRHFKGTVREA